MASPVSAGEERPPAGVGGRGPKRAGVRTINTPLVNCMGPRGPSNRPQRRARDRAWAERAQGQGPPPATLGQPPSLLAFGLRYRVCVLRPINTDYIFISIAGSEGALGERPRAYETKLSKFAGILSAALSQHHLSGLGIAQLEFHHLH